MFAENYESIRRALEGSPAALMVSADVENKLIHFTYARGWSRDEKKLVRETYHAKTAAEYLGGLAKANIPSPWSGRLLGVVAIGLRPSFAYLLNPPHRNLPYPPNL
jgi:hypothetical protein